MNKHIIKYFTLFFFESGFYAGLIAFTFFFSFNFLEENRLYSIFISLTVWIVYGYDRIFFSQQSDILNHSSRELNSSQRKFLLLFLFALSVFDFLTLINLGFQYFVGLVVVVFLGLLYFLNHAYFKAFFKLRCFTKPHFLAMTWIWAIYVVPVSHELTAQIGSYHSLAAVNLYYMIFLNAIATDRFDILGDKKFYKANFWFLIENNQRSFSLFFIVFLILVFVSLYFHPIKVFLSFHLIQSLLILLIYSSFIWRNNFLYRKYVFFDLPLLLIILHRIID